MDITPFAFHFGCRPKVLAADPLTKNSSSCASQAGPQEGLVSWLKKDSGPLTFTGLRNISHFPTLKSSRRQLLSGPLGCSREPGTGVPPSAGTNHRQTGAADLPLAAPVGAGD